MEFVEVRNRIYELREGHSADSGGYCMVCGEPSDCSTRKQLSFLLAKMDSQSPRLFRTPQPMGELLTIAHEIGELVEEKNKAYGDSYGKSVDFLKLLFPSGIPVEKYEAVLFMARVFDKLCRIATDPNAFGEHPYSDLGGYAIRAEAERRRHQGVHVEVSV